MSGDREKERLREGSFDTVRDYCDACFSGKDGREESTQRAKEQSGHSVIALAINIVQKNSDNYNH